jgi:hypothetical protein
MTARVSKIVNVIVPFADQDRALKFYTEALGLDRPTTSTPTTRS